jgi:hypothetical protein
MKTNTFLILTISLLARVKNVSEQIVDIIEYSYFMSSKDFFEGGRGESFPLCDNVEKYCRVWQAIDENIAQAYRKLDTYSYKYTLRLCNTYCFSTTTRWHESASVLLYM